MARVDKSQQEGSIKRTFPRVLPLGTCCMRSIGRCGRERQCGAGNLLPSSQERSRVGVSDEKVHL